MRKDLKPFVLSAMQGDRQAYGVIYEEYAADMYRFALSICKNTYDAQDAVQDTALSVFKSIGTLKNPEKFKSYLFTSLSNACKKRLTENVSAEELADTADDDSGIELSLSVREALGKLDGQSREILMLSVAGGFKSHEIGEILKMPAATVRTKRRRALEKMREELEL
ncbi:MAG: RNA polymerase sigma factor [Oscillospiraceae bacterium]|nr:RNA polymerase sigma factor [Oscillospiraceae bacterium]